MRYATIAAPLWVLLMLNCDCMAADNMTYPHFTTTSTPFKTGMRAAVRNLSTVTGSHGGTLLLVLSPTSSVCELGTLCVFVVPFNQQ